MNNLEAVKTALTTPEFNKVLVLSTAHITRRDSELLDCDSYVARLGGEPRTQGLLASAHRYGNWLYVHDDDGLYEDYRRVLEYSESLIKCLLFARKHHASYINFDRDGSVVDTPELDTHEW